MNNYTVIINTFAAKVNERKESFFQVCVQNNISKCPAVVSMNLNNALEQALREAHIDWIPGTALAWRNYQPIKLEFVSADH